MDGIIQEIILFDAHKNKHGFIRGSDSQLYYFNNDSLDEPEITIEKLSIGNAVSFEIEESSSQYDKATHVILQQEQHKSSAEITYCQPGFARKLNLECAKDVLKKDSGEFEIIKKLATVLRITRVGEHYMDQTSKYEFCFAGATKLFHQFIRESGEFLVIFSHFSKTDWQQKTLKVEREMRRRKDIADRRPLINFYILISNANELRAKVDNVKGEAGAAVIPFSFAELLACKTKAELADCMLKRFNEYYFENDMLGENAAIDDDNLLFGDRGKIADSIVARCHNGDNSGIFGLRRSGKTSVLNAVLRRLEREHTHYVLIESRTYETFSSWKGVLFEIACQICAEMRGVKRHEDESLTAFYKRLGVESSRQEYEERGVASFIDNVKLYTHSETVVIAIDEIELITYNTATSQMWKSLESYKGFWSALRECGCPLVVCGVNSTINEVSNISFNDEQCDNPMYGRITDCSVSAKTYLPAFTDEQTKTMINTLGMYSNIAFTNVYHQINDAFGGQPWAIRQFCSYVFKEVKDKRTPPQVYEVTKPTCENLLKQFKNTAPGITLCKTILQHLRIYQAEYAMLKNIALSPEKYNSFFGNDVILIEHLQKYGLIEYDPDTGYVTFKIDIIRDYICKTELKKPEDMDNNERRRFVQDGIAQCEKKLKRFLIGYYQYAKSVQAGRALFFDEKGKCILKAHKGVDVDSCKFEDFFDHQKFDFYFSKLKQLISNNWDEIGPQFESQGISKEKFMACMEDLNAGRTDADHYDPENSSDTPDSWEIDDMTFDSFRSAFATMNKFFESKGL